MLCSVCGVVLVVKKNGNVVQHAPGSGRTSFMHDTCLGSGRPPSSTNPVDAFFDWLYPAQRDLVNRRRLMALWSYCNELVCAECGIPDCDHFRTLTGPREDPKPPV